jgi:hypothetical protein
MSSDHATRRTLTSRAVPNIIIFLSSSVLDVLTLLLNDMHLLKLTCLS